MRNITFILALLFLWPAIAGCKFSSFSTTEKVTFYLPQLPPSGCTYWQISASCPWEVQTFTTTASSFQLQLSKNQPVSVLAQPITKLANNSKLQFFKPAGTIYPYDFDSDSSCQTLSWENGFSADIMNRLIANGLENQLPPEQINTYISSFNWKKLMETISINQQKNLEELELNLTDNFYNPWQLDSTRLLENLSTQSFSSTYLTPTNLYTVTLDFPLTSSYIPMNHYLEGNHPLTLKKNEPELFLYQENYGVLITGSSGKNISLQWIYVPIIKEAL